METEAAGLLRGAAAGAGGAQVEYHWAADMRYLGQGFEVTVPIPRGALSAAGVEELRAAFLRTYEERFDRVVDGVPVEVVSWRLQAALPAQEIRLSYRAGGVSPLRGQRTVWFPGFGDCEAAVYDRHALAPGVRLRGPAVVEERETSCAFGPDCSFTIDANFNLVIEIDAPVAMAAMAAGEEVAA
jgi:N-methylhydantoinase A